MDRTQGMWGPPLTDTAGARAAAVHAGRAPRRDATAWTLVQGVLAPVQFLVFLVSLALVLRYLLTGEGYAAANVSVVVKTLLLYTIMVTGCDLGEGGLRRSCSRRPSSGKTCSACWCWRCTPPIWWRWSPARSTRAA